MQFSPNRACPHTAKRVPVPALTKINDLETSEYHNYQVVTRI
jgi:hypothetical protein